MRINQQRKIVLKKKCIVRSIKDKEQNERAIFTPGKYDVMWY